MIEKNETFIAGVNCTYAEAIKLASKGAKVIILYDAEETENKRPCIDLVNFSEYEANDFFTMIDNMVGGGADMIVNCV